MTVNLISYDQLQAQSDSVIIAWVRQYAEPDSQLIQDALAIDRFGGVYIAGIGGIVKYDTDGTIEWVKIDTTNSHETVKIKSDFVYRVFGEWRTTKYDFNGVELWTSYYDSAGTFGHWQNVLAIDEDGNVYVAGGDSLHYVLIKYDSNGNQEWIARYATPDVFESYFIST